jgi:hypothetical protein
MVRVVKCKATRTDVQGMRALALQSQRRWHGAEGAVAIESGVFGLHGTVEKWAKSVRGKKPMGGRVSQVFICNSCAVHSKGLPETEMRGMMRMKIRTNRSWNINSGDREGAEGQSRPLLSVEGRRMHNPSSLPPPLLTSDYISLASDPKEQRTIAEDHNINEGMSTAQNGLASACWLALQ